MGKLNTDQIPVRHRLAAVREVARRVVKVDLLTVLLAVISGVSSVLILLRTASYGINLTDDADSYISAARSLVSGDGFTTWTGYPFADRSPLYSVILAIFSISDLDVIKSAEYVNALTFGLTIFVVAMWLRSRIESRFLVVWAACTLALSISLAEFTARPGAESLFILFLCCSLFALDHFLSTQKRSFLVLSAVCAAAALLTRYVAVTLIGSGLLALLWRRNIPLRGRLSNITVWCVVAIAPFSLWILRNLLTVGSILGTVYPDEFTVLRSLHNATNELTLWIFGVSGLESLSNLVYGITGVNIRIPTVATIVLQSAILTYLIIGFGSILARYRPGYYIKNQSTLAVCSTFMLIYSCFWVIERPLTNGEFAVRYLIPLLPPMLVVATITLNGYIKTPSHKLRPTRSLIRNKWLPTLVTLTCSLWLLSWVHPTIVDIRYWDENGRGYRSKEWMKSEVVSYLNDNPSESVIWSTDHAALYFLTDFREREIYRLPLDFAEAKSRLSDDHNIENTIVWFYWRYFHVLPDYSLEELSASLGLEVEAILQDGLILRSTLSSSKHLRTRSNDYLFQALLANTEPLLNAHWDVYYNDSDDKLIYVRDLCDINDLSAKFTLHIFPVDRVNLPEPRRQQAFDDLEFHFIDHAMPISERCIAIVSLPQYDIATIRTGQPVRNDGDNWEAEFTFSQ